MKTIILVLLFITTNCFLIINTCNSQWLQINGPYGGYALSFCRTNTGVLLASTGRGIYSSTNNGDNWVLSNNGIDDQLIYSMKRLPNNTIFAGSNNGILKSTNNGIDWLNTGLQGSSIKSLDAKSDNTIFAISGYSLIYRSTNNGNNWVLVSNGAPIVDLYSIYVHPNGTVFAGDYSGVLRSTNNGTNWIRIQIPQTYYFESLCSNNSGYLFTTTNRGIFRSSNNGDNWINVNSGLTDTSAILIYQNSGFDLYTSASKTGLYKSTNNGDIWSFINNGIADTIFKSLYADSTGYIFTGVYDYGSNVIYRSGDNGNSWIVKNNGIVNTLVSGLAYNQNYLFTSIFYDGIYRSPNKGNSWEKVSDGIVNKEVNAIASSSGIIFAGFRDHSTNDGGIYFSTNSGDNWIYSGLGWYEVTKIFTKSTGEIFAVTQYSGVYRSSDNGINWVSLSGTDSLGFTSMAFKSNGQIVAGTTGHGVMLSTNNGSSWVSISQGPGTINAITVTSNGVIFAGASSGIYKTVNNGAVWTLENNGMNLLNVSALITNQNDKIYASCRGQLYPVTANEVYYSTNYGSEWIEMNSGLTNYYVNNFLIDSDDFLYAGTQGGGIYRTISTTGIRKTSAEIPVNISLSQNYPNPFNPATKIKFNITSNVKRQGSEVKLIIYDITGREIRTLINESLRAGTYEVAFDGSSLPSGVYFYKLSVGDYTETKKMLMIK